MSTRIRVTERQREAIEARGMFDPPLEPVEHELINAMEDGGDFLVLPDDRETLRRWWSAIMDEANGADEKAVGRHADPDKSMRRFHRGDRDALSRLWDRLAAAHYGALGAA